jgi:hypothetical protein
MTKISDRILQIINNEGISVRSFETIIGCSNGTIAKCVSKGTDVSSIWITKILENYPQYSAKWLLTGKEELKTTNVSQKGKSNVNVSGIVGGDVVGGNIAGGDINENHYGPSRTDVSAMITDQYQLLKHKDSQIEAKDGRMDAVFDENRRMTDKLLEEYTRLSNELAKLNEYIQKKDEHIQKKDEDIRKLSERVDYLTDKLLNK